MKTGITATVRQRVNHEFQKISKFAGIVNPINLGAFVRRRMTTHFEWFTAHVSITPARFGSLKAHLLRCTIHSDGWPLFVGLCLGLCYSASSPI